MVYHRHLMTKTVKIDDDDYAYVTKQVKYGESFAKTLKRLLKK